MTEAPPQRLRWRCRRGTLELDWLLVGFLDSHWPGLTADQRDAFERLLNSEDDQLMDWLVSGQEAPNEPSLRALVERIRQHTGL